MPVQPDQKIVTQSVNVAGLTINPDLTNLFDLANGKSDLSGIPYTFATYEPDELNDRGAWSAGTYNAKDLVTYSGYSFVATATTTLAPMTGGVLNTGWSQMWLSAYNRLRANLVGKTSLQNNVNSCVSGPWPCQSASFDYRNLEFYFADPGTSVSVTSACNLSGTSSAGKFVSTVCHHGAGNVAYGIEQDAEMILGGNQSGTLQGDFYILGKIVTGTDGIDPLTLVSVDTANWPFGSFSKFTYSGYVVLWCRVNTTASPGRYGIKVYGSANDDPATKVVFQDGADTNIGGLRASAYNTIVSGSSLGTGGGSFGITRTTSDSVPGIHCTKAVKRIELGNYAPGFFWIVWDNYTTAWLSSPFPQPVFIPPEKIKAVAGTITASVTGFWFGQTYPITDLKMLIHGFMPWNLFVLPTGQADPPKTGGNLNAPPPFNYSQPYYATYLSASSYSYGRAYTSIWEKENTPPDRINQTWYPLGFKIQDANGNIQTCIQAGITGAVAVKSYASGLTPPWPLNLGDIYTEDTSDSSFDAGQPYNWAKLLPAKWQMTGLRNLHIPTDWTAASSPSIGDEISDYNGNTQKCVSPWIASHAYALDEIIADGNGNAVKVTTAGTSGSSIPAWPTVLHDTVNDGTVVWELVQIGGFMITGVVDPTWSTTLNNITQDGTVWWELISINGLPLVPGRARMFSVPAYPCIWDSDVWSASDSVAVGQKILDSNGEIRICTQAGTTGSSQPSWGSGGTSGTEPQTAPNYGMVGTAAEITDGTAKWKPYMAGFPCRGWWIYRVAINKITPNTTGEWGAGSPVGAGDPVGAGGSGATTVDIGIYRNGAFVSFGTYPIGQPIQAMWPVFTNTPLVYQCSERVDIQASIISCGKSFSSGSGGVSYPIAAAYYNDVEALLNLIN